MEKKAVCRKTIKCKEDINKKKARKTKTNRD